MKKFVLFAIAAVIAYSVTVFAQPAQINLKDKFAPQGKMAAVTFDHQAHVAKGLKCPDCHTTPPQLKNITTNAQLDTSNPQQAFHNNFCFACHTKQGVKTSPCNICHK
jgi:hypothetical protein